jgi:Protein of unknown function (DUF1616)
MRRDTIGLAAVTLVLMLIGLVAGGGPAGTVLRTLAGLPLVLILPGYALSPLIVPSRPPSLGPLLWRSMWVAGLSLAVTVLGGLLLNLTPPGLTRVTWTISLSAVTLLALAVSAWLRRRPSSQDRSAQERAIPRTRPGTRIAAGYAAAALAISGTAVGLAIASAGWRHSPGFAQLWLVPARNTPDASLGVRSGYSDAETFHLVVRSGLDAVLSWDFTLGSGQTWQRTISAPAGQHVTAQLTVTGQQSAAQTVDITSS